MIHAGDLGFMAWRFIQRLLLQTWVNFQKVGDLANKWFVLIGGGSSTRKLVHLNMTSAAYE